MPSSDERSPLNDGLRKYIELEIGRETNAVMSRLLIDITIQSVISKPHICIVPMPRYVLEKEEKWRSLDAVNVTLETLLRYVSSLLRYVTGDFATKM